MLRQFVVLTLCVGLSLAGPSSLTRPCYLNDFKCLRDNFAANSNCNTKVRSFIPNAYTIPEFKFETPYFNATYLDENLIIRNHDKCKISEFFFNEASDSALLGIDCPGLVFESNRTLIQHYSLREDSYYSYLISGTYPLIRLTVTLPHANVLDLCSAFVFAEVTALPIFNIAPNDKPTQNFLSRDLSKLNIFETETFFYRGPQLARLFINSLICDFGCN